MITIVILCIVAAFWFFQNVYVPRKIWTFDNPDAFDPRDDIIILTKKNYKGYVTIPPDIVGHPVFTLHDRRFRDLICLWTLAEHGGIWVNPTMHVQHGVTRVNPTMHNGVTRINPSMHVQHGVTHVRKNSSLERIYHSNKEFNGYSSKEGIDTSYMQCKKGTPFICAWRDEYSRMAEFPCVERYLQSRSVGVNYEGMDPLMVAFALVIPSHTIELK
jgi:hypothetical protein